MTRKIIPFQLNAKDVTIVPPLEKLIDDAAFVIGGEMARFRQKMANGIHIDPQQWKIFKDLVDSLIKLNKEARESARAEDLSKLSNEELLDLATKILINKQIEVDTKKQD